MLLSLPDAASALSGLQMSVKHRPTNECET